MADSSTSSLTSTSHTLSAVPAYSGSMATGSTLPSLGDIASALAFRETIRQQARRESLLKPPRALSVASAQISQVALGTFAGQIVDEQQERLRQMHAATAARKKRKRNNSKLVNGGNDNDNEISKAAIGPIGPILKIRRVHVDGFEIPQIWQQANRILDTSVQQTKYALERLDEEDQEEEAAAEAAVNGVDSDEDVDDELSGDEEEESEEEDEEEEEDDDEELSMGEDGEDDFDMEDEEEDDEEEYDDEDEELENGPTKEFVADPSGLNDGFFDIDEFNKQSQWFEAQDARADPNTDAASDDGELDWHADPFSVAGTGLDGKEKKKKKNGKAGKGKAGKKNKGRGQSDSNDEDDVSLLGGGDADEDDEEDDDDGPPIFSDMDLDAPSGESDMEDEAAGDGGLASGMGMDMGADDIFYNDFFAPPAQKRGERDRPGRRSQAARDNNNEDKNKKPFQPDEEDVQRAMNDVRRDLFEQLSDDDDNNDDDDEDGIDALSDVSAGDVRGRRSAHERRQAKILAEIRRLEAEAIKEKKWALAGEASAGARPVNSLLEEDLDFEHTGKPVPVITQEVTEDIEALVKRRILEQSFDEVRRRYGTGFGEDEDRTRRGLVELDDQQSKKGLADVYEETYQAAAHADTHVSQADERQQSDEREVERLWLDISAKLDALSNWQYKPRPAAPQMSVVADVAAVTMEDAQPSTAQGVSGGASLLAPQEVYKPGADDKEAGKNKDKNIIVVAKSGLPVARDEMTREEKQRRRRRNKERIRKSGSGMQGGGGAAAGAISGKTSGKTSVSQKDTMATLKKAGVKVIGKKGELHDLEGNKPRAAQTVSSNYFKL